MITSGGAIPNWQNCARERLGQIIDEAWPNAGMALVKLFADAEFSERYGSVAGTTAKRRLDWLLDATRGDYTVDFAQIGGDNGLKEIMADIAPRYSHFKEIWGSDCGFNAQFQDSHLYPVWGGAPNHSNQVGHFLSSVDASLLDQWLPGNFGLRSLIGHEKAGDENQITEQGQMVTAGDYLDWVMAVEADERGDETNRDIYLMAILNNGNSNEVDRIPYQGAVPGRLGNSLQDLRLSLKGYRFAKWIQTNGFRPSVSAAIWLKTQLGIASVRITGPR